MNQNNSFEERNEFYDRKAWDYFQKVIKNPAMYTDSGTLQGVKTYFDGYCMAVFQTVGYTPLGWFWQAFISYCDQHFYQPGSYGIVNQMKEGRTEQEAWALFFREMNAFITEKGWEEYLPAEETENE